MKTFQKVVILAAVVGLSGAAYAGDTCDVTFQNAVIDDFPNAVVNVSVQGTTYNLQNGVASSVVSVPAGSRVGVTYSVGAGATVNGAEGIVAVGAPPMSHVRFTHVNVGSDCTVSMPLQRVLYTPTVGKVIVGPGTQVNSVTFMPL